MGMVSKRSLIFPCQLTSSRYAIACIAYLVILWQILVHGRAAAAKRGSKVSTLFISIAAYSLVVWVVYPMYVHSKRAIHLSR